MGKLRGTETVGMVSASRGRRGVILISVLIILSFLAVIGLTLIAFVFSRLAQVETETNRLKAFYYAEAGAAMSLSVLKGAFDIAKDQTTGTIHRTAYKDGYYEAFADTSAGTITGIGECHGARREIEIKFKAL